MVTWRSCMASSSALCTLAGRPVDLVGQHQVGEDRPQRHLELAELLVVDPRPDDIGRHQVRRELDAPELDAERLGQGVDRQGLGQAGHPFDQEVAAGQEDDHHPLQQAVLADDDPLHLVEDLLERGRRPRPSAGKVPVLICSAPRRPRRRWRSAPRS